MSFARKIAMLGVGGAVFAGVLFSAANASAVVNENIIQLGEEFQIAVSPMYAEIELVPGQASGGSFRVRNAGTLETDLRIGVRPLEFASETVPAETPRNEMIEWTDLAVEQCEAQEVENGDLLVHLRLREECFVSFATETPMGAPFGEQYMSIFFQEYRQSEGGGMQMVRSISTNVYGTNRTGATGGEGDACGVVSEQKIPFWLFGGALSSTALIENCGRLNFHATVKLEVRGLFGNLVYEDAQPVDMIIPAESKREIADSWSEAGMGIFRVKQSIEALGETHVVESLVFIMPVWLVLVVLGCLTVAVVAFVFDRQRKKRKIWR